MYNGVLMTLEVNQGRRQFIERFPSLPRRPSFLRDLQSIPNHDIGSRFAVEITPTNTVNREDFKGATYWK